MKEEFDATGQHHVFGGFVEVPESRKALPSHWIYKIKRNGAGNVQRVKARLVCGGKYHIEGIDYQATHAPTARLGHIRMALSIAAKYNLEIHQMDVCTAFLGVGWEEEIYMHPPQGYIRLLQRRCRCAIQDHRLCGRWYDASESLVMAWNHLRTIDTALLRTVWPPFGSWHCVLTENGLWLYIKEQSPPQFFCISMISSSLLMSAWLGRLRTGWRGGSGCMILGASPSISAWTSNTIRSITWSTSISAATFVRSWRRLGWMSPDPLPSQWRWNFTRGSPTK